MPNWHHPPFVKDATPREQDIVSRAFHLAETLPERRMVGPLRDAVELLVELIEGRGKRRDFDEHWDRPHDD